MSTDVTVVLRWSVLVLTAFVLQIGVLTDLSAFGVHPELMLLMAICGGLVGGPTRGAEVGFASGLLADLFLPGALGVSALSFALVGFAVGVVEESVIRSSRSISVAIAVVASASGVLLYAGLGQLLGQRTLSDPSLLPIVGIVAVFNGALCVPALVPSRWAEGTGLGARVH